MAEVYAIGFPNGKLYVGVTRRTVAKRLTKHISSARTGSRYAVHRALRKYGRNVRLIVLAQGVPFNEAKDLEIWWISRLNTFGVSGYNATTGGEGATMAPETRRKISETTKGRKLTEDHKRKIGLAAKGRKPTEETKKRISEAKKFSAEHRAKISKATKGNQGNLGKKFSAEHRAKLSEAGKRDWRKRKWGR